MRTGRSNGSTSYAYVYSGSQLKKLTVGGNTLLIQYGTTGMPVGLTYNNTRYYYVTNLQGDVIAILNSSGIAIVTYTYDAWGNILTTTDTSGFGLASKNPLRYRGYVYDQETALYYLQSRYYNPEIGRFISTDDVSYLGADGSMTSYNLFAYCGNNPVNRTDPSGNLSFWGTLGVAVGATLCIAAITILTCGIGTATLAGAIAVGAAKGALIGAAVGVTAGAGIGYAATGTLEGALEGAAIGFGVGAVVGAVVGGTIGGLSYTPPNTFSTYPSRQFNIDPYSLKSQRPHLSKTKYRKNLLETIRNHGKIKEPVLVNRQGFIIDGHHRVEVAKILQQTVNIIIG